MPTQIFEPEEYIYFEINVPKRNKRVNFYVDSDSPIDTYIVDSDGFKQFVLRNAFDTYGGFTALTEHRQDTKLPYEGFWYLIIFNPNNKSVAIHYEVWY